MPSLFIVRDTYLRRVAPETKKVQALAEGKPDEVAERLLEKLQIKVRASEPDVTDLKAEVGSLISSVTLLRFLIGAVIAENSSFVIAYKDLQLTSENLTKMVAAKKQHSSINNVALKGIACPQSHNLSAITNTTALKTYCPISDADIAIVHRVPTTAAASNTGMGGEDDSSIYDKD